MSQFWMLLYVVVGGRLTDICAEEKDYHDRPKLHLAWSPIIRQLARYGYTYAEFVTIFSQLVCMFLADKLLFKDFGSKADRFYPGCHVDVDLKISLFNGQ